MVSESETEPLPILPMSCVVLFFACVGEWLSCGWEDSASCGGGAGDALDHGRLLFCTADQRLRDRDLSPAVLLGRDGQCEDSSAVHAADPVVEAIRFPPATASCCRGPEWLEPVSSFSGGVGGGADRSGLWHLQSCGAGTFGRTLFRRRPTDRWRAYRE